MKIFDLETGASLRSALFITSQLTTQRRQGSALAAGYGIKAGSEPSELNQP